MVSMEQSVQNWAKIEVQKHQKRWDMNRGKAKPKESYGYEDRERARMKKIMGNEHILPMIAPG